MLAYTYISHGKFELIDKPKPELQSPRDAIVHQRPAYQVRQCVACCAWHNRWSRDGWRCGGGRLRGTQRQGRRPRDGQCRNLLRRVFLLQEWLR